MQFDWFSAVQKALDFFGAIAPLTPTPVDDNAVKFLQLVLSNPEVADFINSLLPQGDGPFGAAPADAPPAVMAAAAAAGIDWAKLVELLPVILQIISMFKK